MTTPSTIGIAKRSLERLSRSLFPPACSRRSAPIGAPSARSTGTPSAAPIRSTTPWNSSRSRTGLSKKQFKSVPGVVDVSSFGGITREYQVRVDPDKLIAYGLSIGQVEQQLAAQQHQRRRQLYRAGPAADQCPRSWPLSQRQGHRRDLLKTQNGTACASKILPPLCRARRSGSARSARRSTAKDGKIIDDDDVVEGIVLCRKGTTPTRHSGRHSRESQTSSTTTFCRMA